MPLQLDAKPGRVLSCRRGAGSSAVIILLGITSRRGRWLRAAAEPQVHSDRRRPLLPATAAAGASHPVEQRRHVIAGPRLTARLLVSHWVLPAGARSVAGASHRTAGWLLPPVLLLRWLRRRRGCMKDVVGRSGFVFRVVVPLDGPSAAADCDAACICPSCSCRCPAALGRRRTAGAVAGGAMLRIGCWPSGEPPAAGVGHLKIGALGVAAVVGSGTAAAAAAAPAS